MLWGYWTDMTLEQMFMLSLKSTGSLRHRFDISDSTLMKWILTMPNVTTISQRVEDFRGLSLITSEHHTNTRDSRVLCDNEDIQKLAIWFESHDPFPV
ncbi:hypothetical protein AVEN_212567-1 [Araneus ventricosus]|uniref:Uncharacterized protein n=1 Tax=Araneus ventricosus TaxID=182803 RepID=A0A4Y2P8M6_ARAVE|nr:hypothetical protein AVEN_212567-1 [Araneus ventricosus]